MTDQLSWLRTVVKSLETAPRKLAESVLAMAEREQKWRHRAQLIAQISALMIALSFLTSATYLIAGGHDAAGTILGSVDLVSLVTVFLFGQRLPTERSIARDPAEVSAEPGHDSEAETPNPPPPA